MLANVEPSGARGKTSAKHRCFARVRLGRQVRFHLPFLRGRSVYSTVPPNKYLNESPQFPI